jgi:nitrile hydratase subunit beta
MNGAHDMGGVMGHGPVMPEPNEPVFHSHWEQRMFAMALAMGRPGGWVIDQSRFSRENVRPVDYLSRSYYEIWFYGLTRLLAERGIVAADELAAGKALHPAPPATRVVKPEEVAAMTARGAPADRPVASPAKFRVGDRVRARNIHPFGHTRLPRYVRGHVGTVELHHGGHSFPDAGARGVEEAQHLYTVRFDGSELWGTDSDPTVSVSVDAWDAYLEAAS